MKSKHKLFFLIQTAVTFVKSKEPDTCLVLTQAQKDILSNFALPSSRQFGRNNTNEKFVNQWKWDSRVKGYRIPYEIVTDWPPQYEAYKSYFGIFNQTESKTLSILMQYFVSKRFNEKTNIRFVPKTSKDREHLKFVKRMGKDGCGCCTHLGRINPGGPHFVALGRCYDEIGRIMHELMHVLGFMHEHTRSDRDDYVKLYGCENNIQYNKAPMTKLFGKATSGTYYDYNSIMHYDFDHFRDNMRCSMLRNPKRKYDRYGNHYSLAGQRQDLSKQDIYEINAFYPYQQSINSEFSMTYGESCGRYPGYVPGPSSRIFNGSPGNLADHPYQAKLLIVVQNLDRGTETGADCGGIIISKQHILTAAHCVVGDEDYPDIAVHKSKIVIGLEKLADFWKMIKSNDDENLYTWESVTPHSQYNNKSKINDIAIIKSTRNFEFSEKSFPACLPSRDFCLEAGTKVTVSGWGRTNPDLSFYQKTSSIFNVVTSPIAICANKRKEFICFGDGYPSSAGMCKGDSGGPMGYKSDDDIWTVTGITSHVSHPPGSPSCMYGQVFTRISMYLDWIFEHSGVIMTNSEGKISPVGSCDDSFTNLDWVEKSVPIPTTTPEATTEMPRTTSSYNNKFNFNFNDFKKSEEQKIQKLQADLERQLAEEQRRFKKEEEKIQKEIDALRQELQREQKKLQRYSLNPKFRRHG